MGLNYFASSPTVVLPPQQSNNDYLSPVQRAHSPMGSYRPKYPTPPSLNYQASVSHASAGKKRSIADVDDPEENFPNGTVATSPAQPKSQPIYGPGMTIMHPGQPAWTQTGTWCEQKQAQKEKARPIASSRKSQRMDSAHDQTIPSLNDLAVKSTDNIIDTNGTTIDSLIMSLGVGWKNVMSNPSLRDAARAYARVIENHFNLTDVVVMLEKESLSAYLVRAKQHGVQAFWLFADNLQWCQLVGWSLQRTISNLNAGPVPRVEGPKITARRPTPSAQSTPVPQAVDVAVADEDAMEM